MSSTPSIRYYVAFLLYICHLTPSIRYYVAGNSREIVAKNALYDINACTF